MIVTYNQIFKRLTEELNSEFDPLQFKICLSKENKHFHFIYRYEKHELETNEKIKQTEERLTDITNIVYEDFSDINHEFNDVYNPASRFIYRFMADFIVLYNEIKRSKNDVYFFL